MGRLRLAIAAALILAGVGPTYADEASRDAAAEPTQHFKATSTRSFDDVEHWQRVFDDPDRDEWQRPAAVIEALDLQPGMVVADLGAGTGYFSRYLSEVVGPTGAVIAVETEPNLVAHLRKRAEEERTANVIPVLASFDNPRLPFGTVDLALIVNTFHHIDDRLEYLQNLERSLKPQGRVAIIDWKKKPLPVGPPPPHKIARTQVIEEMNAARYTDLEEPLALPNQYFLVFRARGHTVRSE